ncbi:acyl-CoA dehydratase activase [Metallumcola ferriviriculae]|uniref:Acyl-CoA dehydratase activase n=1 Tax=Metallumcola ferriviriculae TaxID=3039180 RepID=A0AAU0UKT7_9FIRM|nr:acyl-CoA dehydratase activase [Desulfitibacteraceae bacterium MK1]
MICGIDLGSRNVKVVLTDEEGLIKQTQVYDTMDFYRNYGKKETDQLRIDFQGLGLPAANTLVSTGYGRLTVSVAGGVAIPELKAHILGAVFQTGETDFTLLDLGGQDSKIIKVDNGKMVDFSTNDKCAASSGRYLENMAEVLGIGLDELSRHYQEPVELSSTCAVFGESELIGKIIEGYDISRLAAGINYTIFKRVRPMLSKLLSDKVIFTGGVAKNTALQEIIRRELSIDVVVPERPQLNGAIGCCVHGLESILSKEEC